MATAYLYKTLGTPTNTKKYTFSTWVKRALASNEEVLISGGTSGSNGDFLVFRTTDQLEWQMYHGTNTGILKTDRLFRDPSAWYHIVIAYDSANATAGDRMKMYINGVEETSFATDTNPPQDTVSLINSAVQNNIGYDTYGLATSAYFSGVMAHTQLCDGQAYAASDFGETDSTSGIWVAKTSPSVTYGDNGFFLKYQDTSNYGDDSSGNTNDFTMSGTITQTKDTPDNNFATLNPLNMTTVYQPTFSNGNTTVVSQDGSGNYWGSASTLGMKSGKWYAEFKAISASHKPSFGITQAPNECAYWESYLGKRLYDYAYISDGGIYNNDSETASWGNTFTTGDIIMVALDLDNNKIYFGKNGTWENSGDPTSGATGTGAAYTITSTDASTPGLEASGYYHFACSDQGSGQDTMAVNFGNGYFQTTAVTSEGTSSSGDDSVWEYNCPSGYYGLNTKNLGSYS